MSEPSQGVSRVVSIDIARPKPVASITTVSSSATVPNRKEPPDNALITSWGFLGKWSDIIPDTFQVEFWNDVDRLVEAAKRNVDNAGRVVGNGVFQISVGALIDLGLWDRVKREVKQPRLHELGLDELVHLTNDQANKYDLI